MRVGGCAALNGDEKQVRGVKKEKLLSGGCGERTV